MTTFSPTSTNQRVLSGMRPTGALHLGHYHGVLKNWINLQNDYDCYFFVADWHALTTHYESSGVIADSVWDMVIDWLAAGVDPEKATLFIQSRVPQHAELHLLLSMITPMGWLERVPTYKDQQLKLKEKDLATYGFLGYPLLQSADILMYRAGLVPVGEDQVAHVEMTREVARRFNHMYGMEDNHEALAEASSKKMGKKNHKFFRTLKKAYQESGDTDALEKGRELIQAQQNINDEDKERLLGDLEGGGKIILPEPQPLLTPASKMPGLDGQKMSKSYGNTIALGEPPENIEKMIKTMPTDPARVRLTDPGDPQKCPVWQLHSVYSSEETRHWVKQGCQSAGIGCLECKQPIVDAVLAEQAPMRARATELRKHPDDVKDIIQRGCYKAREVAEETMSEVREVMGLSYQ